MSKQPLRPQGHRELDNMLLVVGGHSRNIGKTATASAIIGSTAHRQWLAVKISAHRHGAPHGAPFVLTEERQRDGRSDSSRFLAAGASRSFLLRVSDRHLGVAIPALAALRQLSPNVMIESNRILAHLTPDLYIPVLDYTVTDFKESARRFFRRADAYVVVMRGADKPCWKGLPLEPLRDRPVFKVSPGRYQCERLIKFIETAIKRQAERPPFETPDAWPERLAAGL